MKVLDVGGGEVKCVEVLIVDGVGIVVFNAEVVGVKVLDVVGAEVKGVEVLIVDGTVVEIVVV